MNKYAGIMFVILYFFIAGCKVDYDVTINSDLSGKCVTRVLTMGLVTREQIQKEMQAKGLKNYSMSDYTEEINMGGDKTVPMQGIQITNLWNNPSEMGGMLIRNADGTVTVSMSSSAKMGGKATIRVEGKIDPQSTKGRLISSNTVEFGSDQRITFRFTPEAGASKTLLIIAGIAGLVLILVIIIVAIGKRSGGVSAQTAPPDGTIDVSQGKSFCTECGTEVVPGDIFCAKCGKKII